VGLGYVGLPIAIRLATKFEDVIGFDIDINRVHELISHRDRTGEVTTEQLRKFGGSFTSELIASDKPRIFIVTVPTPVNENLRPDLSPLFSACTVISNVLMPNSIVVFESTVYPGCTMEDCVPILEKNGLKLGIDFSVGYSPERINPGDKVNKVTTINKIVSASDAKTLKILQNFYSKVTDAQVVPASSIEVAEASKILENTQRDVNIALINEFEEICIKIGIDVSDVLSVASTKWNFHSYIPGLVGGHCIGVDPYYMIDKSYKIGVVPELMQSSRRVNERKVVFIIDAIQRLIDRNQIREIFILGLTFKPDCPDFRNSKALEIVRNLNQKGIFVYYTDPFIDDHDPLESVENCAYVDQQQLETKLREAPLSVKLVDHSIYCSLNELKLLTYYDIKNTKELFYGKT
jgi:UDP-N-acetyl-D-glucosamine/UDP-N-acetyl-D-galactosamine dehydrogenase